MTERREKIWLATPHMSDEGYEQKFIQEAFDTNWIAPLGPNVERFEQEVAELSGMKHTLALVSGTAAIHLALKAVGVGPGDIVLCQSLTFSASANPIIYEGATPVFIDSDYETWNMDPKYLEQALETYGEKVKAVIVVHLYGLPADLDPIVELCERYGVALVEDAAESLGSTYKGQMTGSFGDYGIYSFNGNKIITTSGGGMVLSNDKERVDKMRFWATQARDKARHYQHSELGYNYRLSNVLAGVGRGQLMVLDQRVQKKKYIYEYYKRALSGLEGVSFMPENAWADSNYWLSTIILSGQVGALDVIEALEAENIESRPVWKPMHLQPYYESYDYVGGDVGETLFAKGVCLPSDTKLTDEDLERVCAVIRGLWD